MTDDRDFLERCGRLAGQTTYRVPVEGTGTRFSYIPESHNLAAALSFARGPRWNPGPELVYAKATGVEHKRREVVEWLADKFTYALGASGYHDRTRGVAVISYCLVVRGDDSVKALKVGPHVMKLANIG